jgi:hypothetical protein
MDTTNTFGQIDSWRHTFLDYSSLPYFGLELPPSAMLDQ